MGRTSDQLTIIWLTHCYRGQAPSHRRYVVPVRMALTPTRPRTHIHPHGQHQNAALHNHLPVTVHIQHRHAVIQASGKKSLFGDMHAYGTEGVRFTPSRSRSCSGGRRASNRVLSLRCRFPNNIVGRVNVGGGLPPDCCGSEVRPKSWTVIV